MTCGGSEALHERMKRSFDAPAGRAAPGLTRASATGWMVGTAEYQVAPTSWATLQKDQRAELGRYHHGAAGRQRGKRRRHQAVHVEERHDASETSSDVSA
jgi:hypothetical protein